MDLITKEGIFRPRILDYSAVIVSVIEQLLPMTRISGILTKNIIKNYIKKELKNSKIPTSIVGDELITNEVQGVLETSKSRFSLLHKINKLKENIKRSIMKNEDISTLQAMRS